MTMLQVVGGGKFLRADRHWLIFRRRAWPSRAAQMLTRDEVRRIAVNITKLPELSPEVLNALRVYLVKSESSDKPSVVPSHW